MWTVFKEMVTDNRQFGIYFNSEDAKRSSVVFLIDI